MKKIYFTFLLTVVLSNMIHAQVKGKITVENTNPDFFEFHLPFLGFDFSPSNSSLFADFGGKFKKGNFLINIDYRISYVNGLEEFYYNDITTTAHSIYAEKLPKSLLIGLNYIIKKKEKPTTVNFHLKTTGIGRFSVEYYTSIESKQTKFVMVDLGLRKGFNLIQCSGKNLTIDASSELEGFTPPEPKNISTMMDYTMIQAGISFGKTGYWEAQLEGYGLRRTERFMRYYANALFLVNSSIDPIYFNMRTVNTALNSDTYTRYDLNNSKRSKLGVCIGATMNNIQRFGVQMGTEVAYMPGIAGSFKSNLSFTIMSTLSIGKVFN